MRARAVAAGAAVILVILLLLGARAFLRPASAPAGQPPLATLSPANASAFSAAFDARSQLPAWSCSSPRRDRAVCGGPPQPQSFWLGIRCAT